MVSLSSFMRRNFQNDMMDRDVYCKEKRRSGQLIYLGVQFNSYSKEYNYLTKDADIEEGDWVIVPVGTENKPKLVEVVSVRYYWKEETPFPVDKTKWIYCKCSEEEAEKIMCDCMTEQEMLERKNIEQR